MMSCVPWLRVVSSEGVPCYTAQKPRVLFRYVDSILFALGMYRLIRVYLRR